LALLILNNIFRSLSPKNIKKSKNIFFLFLEVFLQKFKNNPKNIFFLLKFTKKKKRTKIFSYFLEVFLLKIPKKNNKTKKSEVKKTSFFFRSHSFNNPQFSKNQKYFSLNLSLRHQIHKKNI